MEDFLLMKLRTMASFFEFEISAMPSSFDESIANTKQPWEILFVGSTMMIEPNGMGPEIQSIEDDPTNRVANAFELGLEYKVGTQSS